MCCSPQLHHLPPRKVYVEELIAHLALCVGEGLMGKRQHRVQGRPFNTPANESQPNDTIFCVPTNTPRPYKHSTSLQTLHVPTNTPCPHKQSTSPQTLHVPTNTLRPYKHSTSLKTLHVPTNILRPNKHSTSLQTLYVPTNTLRPYKHSTSLQTLHVPKNTPCPYKHSTSKQTLHVPTNTLRPHKHSTSPQTLYVFVILHLYKWLAPLHMEGSWPQLTICIFVKFELSTLGESVQYPSKVLVTVNLEIKLFLWGI